MKAHLPLPILCVLLLSCPGTGRAQAVYKSVDAQGNVTYSSAPPPTAAGAEPVTIRSDAGREASLKAEHLRQEAELQRQEVERDAAESRKQREEQKEQKAATVATAEKRLKAARDGLEAAKRQGDDERKTLERSGPGESQAYRDRVEREERKVREAERALKDAKAGKVPIAAQAEPQAKSHPPEQTKPEQAKP